MSNDNLNIQNISDILSALPGINNEANFWMVRANSGIYYTDFIMRHYVGIGHNEISLQEAKEQTNERLMEIFKERKPKDEQGNKIPTGTYTTWIGQLKRFANELTPGDYVVVPSEASERFSLGVVVGDPMEYSDEELSQLENVEGRENSPYKKRIQVQFLKSFNRSEADPALYKMIYTQATLSQINQYASYILRAVFDAYVSDDKIYLTFPVNQKKDIPARPFTSFTYHLTESYHTIDPEVEPIIKSNVQSEGIVQLVLALSPMAGIFMLVLVVLRSKIGFTIKVNLKQGKLEFKKTDNGVIAQKILDDETRRQIDKQRADEEHLAKMIDLANQVNIPMNEIQATISNELKQAAKKAAVPDDNTDNTK